MRCVVRKPVFRGRLAIYNTDQLVWLYIPILALWVVYKILMWTVKAPGDLHACSVLILAFADHVCLKWFSCDAVHV